MDEDDQGQQPDGHHIIHRRLRSGGQGSRRGDNGQRRIILGGDTPLQVHLPRKEGIGSRRGTHRHRKRPTTPPQHQGDHHPHRLPNRSNHHHEPLQGSPTTLPHRESHKYPPPPKARSRSHYVYIMGKRPRRGSGQ